MSLYYIVPFSRGYIQLYTYRVLYVHILITIFLRHYNTQSHIVTGVFVRHMNMYGFAIQWTHMILHVSGKIITDVYC